MSGRVLVAVACGLVVLAVLLVGRLDNQIWSFVLVGVAGAVLVLALARWRPERVAIAFAVLVVLGSGTAAVIRVVEGVDAREVRYDGELDAEEILDQFYPAADGKPRFRSNPGGVRLDSASGTALRPRASTKLLVLWAFVELAPWLLAGAALAFLVPALRSSSRGDAFDRDAARSLRRLGTLLLFGIPALPFLEFYLANRAEGSGFLPIVTGRWNISLAQFLPGLLVLVLARVFAQGAELRELERRTV